MTTETAPKKRYRRVPRPPPRHYSRKDLAALTDFNARFLTELARYNPQLRDLSTGHQRHPLLVLSFLRTARIDVEIDGLDAARLKWANWIGGLS